MSYQLREYQESAVGRTIDSFASHQAALLVLATGLGKTVVAAHIANHFKDAGRILLLAHREELIFQGQRTLEKVLGQHFEIEMGESYAGNGFWSCGGVCSTYQTQIAGRDGGRMTRFKPDQFSLVIADEAHHAVAPSQRRVLDYYRQNPKLKVLGLTATPDRADEEALGQVFEDCPVEFDILDGINGGWLVPVQQQAVFVHGLDYSAVRTVAGDLNGKDLAEVLEYEEILHGMTTPILDICGNKKTLIFTATVGQAERMSEILNRHKPGSAEYVCGETPKEYRRGLFEKYAAGKIQYLCNVGVLTEGFDEPGVEWVVMGRPTKSRSLYSQMVGRGTRALPGVVDGPVTAEARIAAIAASPKQFCNVMDFVGNAGRHKLIHMTDVLGGRYPEREDLEDQDEPTVAELAQEAIEQAGREGKPANVATELQKAEREIDRRRRMKAEAKTREKVTVRAKYSTAKINPFDVLDMMPCRVPAWHAGRPMTDGQKAALEKFGVDTAGLDFAHASQLMDRLVKRIKEDRPSFKMTRILRRYGFDTETMTFAQGRAAMDLLAKNGWKRVPQPV